MFRTILPPEQPILLQEGDMIAARTSENIELIVRSKVPPRDISKLPLDITSMKIDIKDIHLPPAILTVKPTLDLIAKIVSGGALLIWLERDRSHRLVVELALVRGIWGRGRPIWQVRTHRKLALSPVKAVELLSLLHVVPLTG